MKELLVQYFERTYYMSAVTFLLGIFTLIVSIRKHKQNRKLKPLFFFLLGYILNQAIVIFLVLTKQFSDSEKMRIFYYVDFIDTIIEFLAFFFLIKNYILNVKVNKALNPLLPIFIGTIAIYFLYYKKTHTEIDNYFLQMIFTIQASFLIIACGLYYLDLFIKEPKLSLANQPAFWAVTGLAFCMLCTLPYSLLGLFLVRLDFLLYDHLFTIFQFFYCVLFSMIIKAYFCKPERFNEYRPSTGSGSLS